MGGPSTSAREMRNVRQLRCVRLNFRFVRKDVEGSLLLYAVIRCFGLLFLDRNISADMIVIKYKYGRDRDSVADILDINLIFL
jgi:hypothetical protein